MTAGHGDAPLTVCGSRSARDVVPRLILAAQGIPVLLLTYLSPYHLQPQGLAFKNNRSLIKSKVRPTHSKATHGECAHAGESEGK